MIGILAGLLAMIAVLLLLVGCGMQSGPGPEIHDTKYLAIGPDGHPVNGPPGDNDCVKDRFIGLVWEVKSDLPGLRDWRNTYSWHSPDESFDGELDYRGEKNAGVCPLAMARNCAGHGFLLRKCVWVSCGPTRCP